MIDKIRTIMEHTKLSQQDFAARIGISAASLSSILNGRTQPTNRHVMGIHQAFPEINVNWLLFGEGDMLVSDSPAKTADVAAGGVELADGMSADAVGSNAPGDLFAGGDAPSLFSSEVSTPSSPSVEQRANAYGSRREGRSVVRGNGNVVTTAINVDKDERKIKEIRVFYSNGTYESFVPSTK